MKIEEEIMQARPFKSEFQKLMINIHFTSSWFNSSFGKLLKPFGISPTQYNVLRILKGRYPESYCNQAIAERMIDRSSNATRIVDKLEIKKLILRKQDTQDRRLVNISLTTKGIELLEEIDQQSKFFKAISKSFNEEKAKLMNEWLDELRD